MDSVTEDKLKSLKEMERKRPFIIQLGKKLRNSFNRTIKRHSPIGNEALPDKSYFPWLEDLEANWETIRDEAVKIWEYRDAIPSLSDISPDHASLDDEKKWRSYFFQAYGVTAEENCVRCPKTTALLGNIPGLRTAVFSIHEPGMVIAPHTGVTAAICVVHMGLKIPKDYKSCAIRVEDHIVHWQDGKSFVFDDTLEHETWNRTDEDRIILLLHVDRPVRFPGSLAAWAFLTGVRLSPFIGDARKEMASWNEAFEKLEAEKAGKP